MNKSKWTAAGAASVLGLGLASGGALAAANAADIRDTSGEKIGVSSATGTTSGTAFGLSGTAFGLSIPSAPSAASTSASVPSAPSAGPVIARPAAASVVSAPAAASVVSPASPASVDSPASPASAE